MTTVVGVLNKAGVALAADSAGTVIGGRVAKTYNHSLKIFTLSKLHPVGVAIYNNLEFYGIPWETIIKEYRRQLGNKSFDTLEEYRDNFFKWLKDNEYFHPQWTQDGLLQDFNAFCTFLANRAELLSPQRPSESKNQILISLAEEVFTYQLNKENPCEHTKSVSLVEEKETLYSHLGIISSLFTLPDDQKRRVADAYLDTIKAEVQDWNLYTGIVFTGFGDKELLPRIVCNLVSIVLNGVLKHHDDRAGLLGISEDQQAIISPYAQTDVVNTVLYGTSTDIRQYTSSLLQNTLEAINQGIKNINGISLEAQTQIEQLALSRGVQYFEDALDEFINKQHVDPMLTTLVQLSKEDMAEMAESLVYLTYLKRRITFADETVGGPVDVAVITKGDGFVWIKRKHYFDPTINRSFFQKYLYPQNNV